jgi:hypothetical protein
MAEPVEKPKSSAKSLYSKLEAKRSQYLNRAYDCSELTIPALLPRLGHTDSSKLPTPWQGLGARGVNNLAAKLLLTLFPPNTPIFKLDIDDFTLETLTKQEGMRAKVEEGLNKIERSVMKEIESSAIRVTGFEGLKHLVVTGNVLFYMDPEGGAQVFHLDSYVVRRDRKGNVLDIVVKECVSPVTLPQATQDALLISNDKRDMDEDVELYTHIKLTGKKYAVYQETEGNVIPGSEGNYPVASSPWIPVRFTKISGESYGRSYVEEYIGDLQSLEGLSQAIVEGAAASAKVLFLVNPNGVTEKADLAKTENGGFVDGMTNDVQALQVQKGGDFRVAHDTSNKIEERLSFAFLLNSAIQRGGDRVTAEEIRFMANELESALGGLYSILSLDLQLPLVKRLMYQMERQKRLPMLPKGVVTPTIVTGMEALGRGNDLNKLSQFMKVAVDIAQLPPEIDKADALKRVGVSLGIDMKGLVKTPEALQAEVQQQQQREMMMQGMNPAINAASQIAQKGMEQNGNQAQQIPPG